MGINTIYTNGVIAVREKYLLGKKLLSFCDMTPEIAYKNIRENGFAVGFDSENVYDYEKSISFQEEKNDAFIREYAPSNREKYYFLANRDFHNAKAILKSEMLGISTEAMLCPEGVYSVETIKKVIQTKQYSSLYPELSDAIKYCFCVVESGEELTGSKIGAIFETAQFKCLLKLCGKNSTLKKMITAKMDMTNILTAIRCDSYETAIKYFVPFGNVNEDTLKKIFDLDENKREKAFNETPYKSFYEMCYDAKVKGVPPTQAEKYLATYDILYFEKKKYELKNSEPFMYFVLRSKIDCINVRILLSGLIAGLSDQAIKNRLRGL